MDKPEKLATGRGNQKWTNQRNWQHEGAIKNGQTRESGNTKGQSKMDKPEKQATQVTQNEDHCLFFFFYPRSWFELHLLIPLFGS